jgi:type I restriction enzyme, S subunit
MKLDRLPIGWAEAPLSHVADVRLGRQRSPSKAFGQRMRPYLRAANVGWDGLKLDDVLEMAFTEQESESYELRPGDLLLSEASGSPGEVGKPALWKGEIPGCCFQNTLIRVRPREVISEYLLYFFKAQALNGAFAHGSRGIGIHHLGAAALTSWLVCIPPLNEQRRIVKAIEAALSVLDAGAAYLDAAAGRFERAQESIVLSEVWDRAFELQETKTVAVGDVAEVGSGTTPSRSNPAYWQGGEVPWATSGSVMDGLITRTEEFVTAEALARTTLKVWPRGTLLLAMYGEGRTRGRCAELGIDAACNQACAAIRVRDDTVLLPGYLKLLFDARYRANRLLGGGGVQQNLNQGIVRNMEVPLPPLDFQHRAIAAVETQMTQLDAIRRATGAARQRARSLRRAVLDAAFSGRLVPRDPTDEPAEKLLERLATIEPPVRRRGRRAIDAGVPA